MKAFGEFKSVYDAIDIQGLDVETGVSGAATKLTVTIAAVAGGEITIFGVDAFCDGAGSALLTILDSVTTIGYAGAAENFKIGHPFAPSKGIRVATGPLKVVSSAPAAGSIYLSIYHYNAVRPARLPA